MTCNAVLIIERLAQPTASMIEIDAGYDVINPLS
jgi:hypothetical protein